MVSIENENVPASGPGVRVCLLLSRLTLSATVVFCIGLAFGPEDVTRMAGNAIPSDKLFHGAGMFLVTVLAAASAPGVRLHWIAALALALSTGVELAQGQTGRDADPIDLAWNIGGVFLAVSVVSLLSTRSPTGTPPHAD
jgi:hypothetical protein